VEDGEPRRIAQRLQSGMYVSFHLRKLQLTHSDVKPELLILDHFTFRCSLRTGA
jgi:hypothetical protein